MGKKLVITYISIVVITMLVTVLFSWQKVNRHFFEQTSQESQEKIVLIDRLIKYELMTSNQTLQEIVIAYGEQTNVRITLINDDGVVLADSLNDPKTMENHRNRTEFKNALRGILEPELRYSSTMGAYLYYFTKTFEYEDMEGVLRISVPADNIQDLVKDLLQSVVIGLLLGLILSSIAAYFFIRRLMQPINELTQVAEKITSGDYDHKVYVDDRHQLGKLADAFNLMTFTMRKNMWQIEQKNAELESILVSMDLGLAAIDESYKIVFSNQPFSEILGINPEIEGKLFYEVIRNTHMFKVIEQSIEEGEYIEEETTISQGADTIVLKISASPIKSRTSQNTLHGILIIIEDVTKIRKLELIRQEFVSNVTHELKTPLTSIKGFVDTLKHGAMQDPDVAERFLDIIDIEAERLALLIEDILLLSEIESMKIDRQVDTYSVATIVDEVVDILSMKAQKKGLKLEVNVQEDLPNLECNKNRMKQLLINLIDNSIKYTEEGSVHIACTSSRDYQHLNIEITDTGIGIEQEHLERLFERFYRVDKGRSRKQGGTGLGLSIVKHIVELYHGKISVKSQVGHGTTMKVKLPFKL